MKTKASVKPMNPSMGRIFQRTDALRWEYRGNRHILQQGWFCTEDGAIEWRDVPMVMEKTSCVGTANGTSSACQKAV